MATGKEKCFTCAKDKIVYLCEGCSQKFCLTDLTKHRQTLHKEYESIITDCDEFRQKIIEQKHDPNQYLLIQKIATWETKSIKKIRQTAEECRQILLQQINDNLIETEKELNKFIADSRQIRQDDDFNEIHLNQLKIILEKLKKEFDRPSSISIQEDTTAFISKLSVSTNISKAVNTSPNDIDLSGKWTCDDGGLYYIRQLNNVIWWFGVQQVTSNQRPRFSNVLHGTIDPSVVNAQWCDVPLGRDSLSGLITFEIINVRELKKNIIYRIIWWFSMEKAIIV
ncbi:unnamed protein product [Rotaria sp. Silwood2]|nr:unnamed protein product [Rotaria sp. Silwood2]CAF3217332.1 unnamed protein product [Rotaria sp. Silwood2]CAF4328009.1 unnamed protein product [Rotaria sp. Silwood2]CAF4341454.1 unnamed protein product [Rotaria sp. Silwood2]